MSDAALIYLLAAVGARRQSPAADRARTGVGRDQVEDETVFRTMFSAKIHRATVTHADLHYVGSVTIDAELLEAADLLPGEQVSIVDVTNGARLETYIIEGERGSGVIGINGAAAHHIAVGDVVIIIAYQTMTDADARRFVPRVVHVDAANRLVGTGTDPATPSSPNTSRPPFATSTRHPHRSLV